LKTNLSRKRHILKTITWSIVGTIDTIVIGGLITGDWTQITLDQISLPSLLSWLYLIIFGSIVAFSSYVWLLKQTDISRVSTHAYINPLVAVILGWALAEEALTASNAIAAIVIILSVVVITTFPPEKIKSKTRKD